MFENAKVGDRVWGIRGHGEREDGTNGIITEVILNNIYIRFDGDTFVLLYRMDGRYSSMDCFASLFWRKPVFEIPEPPILFDDSYERGYAVGYFDAEMKRLKR